MPEVIDWLTGKGDEVIFRHPRTEINWGDTVNVLPNQLAIFIKDSKVYDVLEPGRHLMKTQNIPLLTRALSAIVGYDKNPFHCSVIFVNMSQFQGKFGGRSQTKELAPLQFFGDYFWKIKDPNLFAFEIAGNRNIFTTSAFNEFFRNFFVQEVMSVLSEKSIVDILQDLELTSNAVEDAVAPELEKLGIELLNLKFGGIDTTPEYRDRLFWMRAGVAPEKIQQYSGMAKVAEKLPEGGGGGLAGAVVMNNLFSQNQVQKAEEIKSSGKVDEAFLTCNQCGATFSPSAKFCPQCGDPTDDEKKGKVKYCPNCGAQADPTAKFCGACGFKLK
ncbi:MAG: SPFH domain-containing protein [Candidatus Heimdallarchaeum aukensis]|uniref:SPFH domain-containing protein n=1 Tax=Candidatus Heimdallarchaeum aukensis TaxID=2876573 RepID=A0A9Y1FLP4_9ARCH|nr:MAG: SPFH domain-containing protein [Candidatus Heimdallarchaeum aukensis]